MCVPTAFCLLVVWCSRLAPAARLDDRPESVGVKMTDLLAEADRRINADIRVVEQVYQRNVEVPIPPQAPAAKKVAFMFMVGDKIHQAALWRTFFMDESAAGNFAVYIHRYLDTNETQDGLWQGTGAQVTFVERVQSNWGQLAGVEVALFRAALQDPENTHFVLLSEGHVPFKSFGYVYAYITARSKSRICINEPSDGFSPISDQVTGTCVYRDQLQSVQFRTLTSTGQQAWYRGRVRQHHQWVILNRHHASAVFLYAKPALEMLSQSYKMYFKKHQSNYDPVMWGASDETFVVIAILLNSERQRGALEDSMQELEREGVEADCTNFVFWRNCFANTDLGVTGQRVTTNASAVLSKMVATPIADWFHPQKSPAKAANDSPRDFGLDGAHPSDEYLQSITDAGFLFGRKFGYNAGGVLTKPLDETLPLLWERWDADFGERTPQSVERMFKRLPSLDVGQTITRQTLEECCATAVGWMATVFPVRISSNDSTKSPTMASTRENEGRKKLKVQ